MQPPVESHKRGNRDVDMHKSGGQIVQASILQAAIVGAGFLADAYDLFVIDLVLSVLTHLYPFTNADRSLIASATLLGAIVGQIVFGLLGDWFGRRLAFIYTCVLTILGSLLSGCVSPSGTGIVTQLALCRFALGVGVGGEYPLAATIAAEGALPHQRGSFVASVFSMQGVGVLLACLSVLALLALGLPLELVWRLALMLGSVPSLAVVAARSKMQETEIFEASKQTTLPAEAWSTGQLIRYHWRNLLGTTMTWFLLDITFYGTGSFKHRFSTVLNPIHPSARQETARGAVWDQAIFATMCACLAIPGYLLSIAFIDTIGRFKLQFWGFVAMAVNFFFVSVGISLEFAGGAKWFLLLGFAFTFLFSNFGPNTTTFVLPTEIYPTQIRATCHGLSAAAGKVGAAVGTAIFSPCESWLGLETVLVGCGLVSLVGAGFTFAFTPRDTTGSLGELDPLRTRSGVLADKI